MNVPVVIFFFNRIKPLQALVARLSEVRPSKVYLVSDGARGDRDGETQRVEECREYMSRLPWECEIRCNFAQQNMGCRNRVISGIDWVFEEEERAVFLEDDCIPELSFFSFMDAALEKYKDNPKVISIGATNYSEANSPRDVDVLFTKYPVSTGWGTWRAKWKLMDRDLKSLPDAKRTHQLRKWLGGMRQELYWHYVLAKKTNSWAYRWAYTAFINEMYCGLSTANLIANVGFDDPLATNTTVGADVLGFPPSDPSWVFRGRLPDNVVDCEAFTRYIEDVRFSKSFVERCRWLWRKIRNRWS